MQSSFYTAIFICVIAVNIVYLHAVPYASSYNVPSLILPTGRRLHLSHLRLPSHLRHLTSSQLLHSLHEVTDCHLHTQQGSINLCDQRSTERFLPDLDNTPITIDGISFTNNLKLSLTLRTTVTQREKVTIAYDSNRVPVVAWINGVPSYAIDLETLPGVLARFGKGTESAIRETIVFSDDAVPIPKTLDATEANGSTSTPAPSTAAATDSCRNPSNARQVEIATAFDAEFCKIFSLNGEQAVKTLRALVAEAETAFSTDTCLRLKVSSFDGTCSPNNDPYSDIGTDPLETFRQYWIDQMKSVKRDVAYFISGAEDGTSTAGRAYISATCNDVYGYGWAEGKSPAILAHELGHTFGASHADSGLMTPTLSGSDNLKFSKESLDEIISFIDTGGASTECLAEISDKDSTGSTQPPPTSAISSSPSPSKSGTPQMSSSPSASPMISPTPSVSSSASAMPKSKAPSPSPLTSRDPKKSPKVGRTPDRSHLPSASHSPTASNSIMSASPEPSAVPTESAIPLQPSESATISSPAMPDVSSEPKFTSTMTVVPTKLPQSPSPTHLEPKIHPGTCAEKYFAQSKQLECTYPERLGSLGTRLGTVSIFARQRNNRFQVFVESETGEYVKIKSVRAKFSFFTDSHDMSAIREKESSQGKRNMSVFVRPDALKLPSTFSSCCEAPLYIDIQVKVIRLFSYGIWNYNSAAEARGVYTFFVNCKPSCGPKDTKRKFEQCPDCPMK